MAIDDLVVETSNGPVRGVDDGRVKAWKGIRYAAAPVGDLRFRAPQPPERWTEIADATVFGPACPQPVFPNMPLDLGAPQGEDCLRLNVWASSETRPGTPNRSWCGCTAAPTSWDRAARRSMTAAGWSATATSSW